MGAPFAAPKPSQLAKESIQRLAEGVARQLGAKPGADLRPIVESLGGSIIPMDFWEFSDSESGSAEILEEGEFKIFLPNHTTQERDRFTIAHELGHYVLHYLWHKKNGANVGPTKVKRYGSDRVEWEANWFAASFLMPADDFKRHWIAMKRDPIAVSRSFGVSPMAAEVRAKALGLKEG